MITQRGFKSSVQPTGRKKIKTYPHVKDDPSDIAGVTGKHNFEYRAVTGRVNVEISKDEGTTDGGFGRR